MHSGTPRIDAAESVCDIRAGQPGAMGAGVHWAIR